MKIVTRTYAIRRDDNTTIDLTYMGVQNPALDASWARSEGKRRKRIAQRNRLKRAWKSIFGRGR